MTKITAKVILCAAKVRKSIETKKEELLKIVFRVIIEGATASDTLNITLFQHPLFGTIKTRERFFVNRKYKSHHHIGDKGEPIGLFAFC